MFSSLSSSSSSFNFVERERMEVKKFTNQEIINYEEDNLKNSQQFWRIMEVPELSLAPTRGVFDKSTNSSLPESETNLVRKRKSCSADHLLKTQPMIQTNVDLQLKDPLPLDWEQCLDLESGRMYYLNRKTLRKSWEWPKDQKLDLDLNISSSNNEQCSASKTLQDSKRQHFSSNSNMVALACLNCHLLVIVSKSSPSCPNCKYVHSLPTQQSPSSSKVHTTVKSLDTLSLLN
ncbi:hypothetical protein F0562_006048 [Nyssa sinensis]|uniref:WW domain-containing protein n=1 Tax=Nyssa sinensis TaxID=561372 RepID=A0A5J5AMA2_9ASTE|nr:hypothetical protein F0562_006048 [Nyssa sinensis]